MRCLHPAGFLVSVLFSLGLSVVPPAVHAGGLRGAEHQASGSGRSHGGSSGSQGGGSQRGGGTGNGGTGNGGSYGGGGGRSYGGGGGGSWSYGRYGAGSMGPNAGYLQGPSNCGDFGSCGGDSFSLAFLAYTVGLPFSLPRLFDDDRLRGYAAHPFAEGPGLLRLDPDDPATEGMDVRNVALAVELESGYQLQGVVPATMAMRLLLPWRMSLDARVSLLSDTHEHPTQLGAAGTTDLTFRFAQGQHFDFRAGLGVRNFTVGDMRWGIDFVYAVDAYFASNLVLRLEAHVGNADKALVAQARATFGVTLGPCELYAGYDHTVYHDTGSARLGGPVGGLRVWF